ncbi:MAG: murein hydrolase activator EnvC family protein [bacterium]
MTRLITISALILICTVFAESSQSLRAEIEKNKSELQSLERKEADELGVLDALSRRVILINDLVEELLQQDSVLTRRLDILNDSLAIKREELDSANALRAELLRAMFIRGKGGDYTFLLASDGMGDFMSRVGYFVFLAKERAKISAIADSAAIKVEILIDSTENVHSRVIATRLSRETELDSLRAAKKHREQVISNIRKDKNIYQRAIAQMEESLAQLTREIPQGRLEGNFERFKGSLPWPTASTSILHPFGIVKESRFGTEFKNAGIDIATKPEERVASVAPGRVAQISWLRGYGRIIILEHEGGYFSVYGNLGHVVVDKGQNVSKGDSIGYTAAQGWLEGAKLHFEIRKGKEEVNPLEWLVTA